MKHTLIIDTYLVLTIYISERKEGAAAGDVAMGAGVS
jgi:hypothetical protein